MDTVGTEQMNQPRGTFFAVALIVAGVFLFLDNIGVLQIDNISAYLPLTFIVFAGAMLARRTNLNSMIWATALASFGVLLTLGNLGVVRAGFGIAWPILLITFGVTALVNRNYWAERQSRWHEWHHRPHRRFRDAQPGALDEVAVFFSINRRLDGREVTSGDIVAVFGSVEIDFNGALIPLTVPEDGSAPVRRAEVEVAAVFGSVEIRVPAGWRVLKDGAGVFGSYEDRTIPYRPEPGVEPPTLVLSGAAVFGSVTIEN